MQGYLVLMIYNGIPQSVRIGVAMALAVVILFFTYRSALNKGQVRAQADSLTHNALVVTQGLVYFNKDQNRYPAATEFAERNIMLPYFDNFPPLEFPTVLCQQSFLYKRATPTTYEFNFCLPSDSGGFKAGWNLLSEKSIANK